MQNSIYFIGGASAAGKSAVTTRLAARDGRTIIELDRFYDLLQATIRDSNALEKATRQIALEVVKQLLASNAYCLIEGGWIAPAQASLLKEATAGRFHPVYCGYPYAKVKKRLALIQRAQQHWLAWEPEKKARAFLRQQIEESAWYRRECEKYHLPFFDFSKVEEGAQALILDYSQWQQSPVNGEPSSKPDPD